jgi:sugar phosphate permease
MNTETSNKKTGPIYYGWFILAVVFIAQLMTIGLTSYSFGLFVLPVSSEFGLSRADTNIGLMTILTGMAFGAPFVGSVLDRFSARLVMAVSVVGFAGGLVAISFATSPLLVFALLVFPVSLCAIGSSHLMTSTMVSRWFYARRGQALGIAALSASVSGVLVVKTLSYYIEHVGWRLTLRTFGVFEGVLIVALALLIIRDRPSDIGVPIDGIEASAAEKVEIEADDRAYSWRRLLKSRDMWLIALATGTLMSIDYAFYASLVPYGRQRGLTSDQAANLMATVSIVAFGGKLVSGYLCDRIDKRWLMTAVSILMVVFMVILGSNPSYAALLVACATAGLAIGATVPVWYASLAQRFGTRSYGTVLGLTLALHLPLELTAVRFAGVVFDRTGGYEVMFITFACMAPLAALLLFPVSLPSPMAAARRRARDAASQMTPVSVKSMSSASMPGISPRADQAVFRRTGL